METLFHPSLRKRGAVNLLCVLPKVILYNRLVQIILLHLLWISFLTPLVEFHPPPNFSQVHIFKKISYISEFEYCYKVFNVSSICGDKDDMDYLCFIFHTLFTSSKNPPGKFRLLSMGLELCLRLSRRNYPVTWRRIPEEWRLQPHCCVDLKSL